MGTQIKLVWTLTERPLVVLMKAYIEYYVYIYEEQIQSSLVGDGRHWIFGRYSIC